MTSDDKFHVFERITALHEVFGKTPSSRTLGVYWDSLCQMPLASFDAALERAAREVKHAASPAEIRELGRDTIRVQGQRKEIEHLCHFHGDGQFERASRGRPDEPSTNKTAWWCSRCTHFVKLGQQEADQKEQNG